MTTQEVLEACVNKQLESYHIGYDDVKKGSTHETFNHPYYETHSYLWGMLKIRRLSFDKIPWYQAYTFNSEEEYQTWRDFCINLFRKELKLSKWKAKEQFTWLDFNYGLRQNYQQ